MADRVDHLNGYEIGCITRVRVPGKAFGIDYPLIVLERNCETQNCRKIRGQCVRRLRHSCLLR
jgi:hypothetical protein